MPARIARHPVYVQGVAVEQAETAAPRLERGLQRKHEASRGGAAGLRQSERITKI